MLALTCLLWSSDRYYYTILCRFIGSLIKYYIWDFLKTINSVINLQKGNLSYIHGSLT